MNDDELRAEMEEKARLDALEHVHDEGNCCECGGEHCCCDCPTFC